MNSRIKQLRTALKLTLEEFGDRIGVTRAAVSKWENGDRGIADSMVVSICREFNVNEQWLRTGEGRMLSNEREAVLDRLAEKYDLNADDRDVLAAYLRLTPEQRDGIKAYMANLLEIKSGHAAQPRRVEVSDDVAAAVVNVHDEVAQYNSEVAEENASGGKEFSSTG
jgi:transcriptional regulator with XRE-family HTH domain